MCRQWHSADAVALVGDGAYLYGESVIAMHGLAPTNPTYVYIATPKRVRRKLPRYLRLIHVGENHELTEYEGICSQSISDAIRSCRATMMPDRLLDAVDRARAEGHISRDEADTLRKEISRWEAE